MNLPPGFLDELRTRTSLSQVVGRKVMWDARKSNQGKGDMWAPCPFHQEKSASFHVDDRKGFYYCFGCHAKGDALSFIRETENVGFMEAVEILAREAGMTMPVHDPEAQHKADRRTQLIAVMEQAVQFYRLQMNTGQAGEARAYMARRGMDAAALERWQIGFAPPGWQALWDALRAKGVAEDLILECGLAKASAKGKQPYDVFRHRIMFPIRDAQGRAIAFGGRAMDPEDKAKYLNSPETPLFDKGRSLYNFAAAREAAGKGGPLIVAEGYMDVIALSEAGFPATVAPLGTAVTENQLRLMWRISDEPVIALDGDTAGLRAAMRVIDVALPLLEAGKGLRFCLMPPGLDPDDLLRAQGAGAMQKLLDQARPMVDLLWQRETEGGNFDSPERRAALDKSLRAAIAKIADPHIRTHYGAAIKDMRWALFNPRGGAVRGRTWQPKGTPQPATPTTRASLLAQGNSTIDEMLREAVILAVLLTHPRIVPQFEDALQRLDFLDPDHGRIAAALVQYSGDPDFHHRVAVTVGGSTIEKLLSSPYVKNCIYRHQKTDFSDAKADVLLNINKLLADRGHATEVMQAMSDVAEFDGEVLTERVKRSGEAALQAEKGDEKVDAEFEIAPNGAKLDRRLRRDSSALFDSLLSPKLDRPQ